jgi:tetratricopeptide (TPR) repeat protein
LIRYRESYAVRAAIAEADPGSAVARRNVGRSHTRIGNALMAQNLLDEALSHFQQGLAIDRSLAAADPSSVRAQRDLAIDLQNVADVERARRNYPAAQTIYQESIDIGRRLAAAHPESTGMSRELATTLQRMGDTLAFQDNWDARIYYDEAYAIVSRLLSANPDEVMLQNDVLSMMVRFALLFRDSGITWTEVEALALDLDRRGVLTGADPPQLANIRARARAERGEE